MSAIGRSLRSLAVLAVLGAAAGLYAWYGVAQKDKAEAARKDADERLFRRWRLSREKTRVTARW